MAENVPQTPEQIALERFKTKISLAKFILGTFILGLFSLLVKRAHDEKEQKLKEFELIGSYVKYALVNDVKMKKSFSRYFATMSTYPEFSARWKEYDGLVNMEILEATTKTAEKNDSTLKFQKKHLIDSMLKECSITTTSSPSKKTEIRKELKEQSVKYEEKKIVKELEIADLTAQILASPAVTTKSDVPAEKPAETASDIAAIPLAKTIVAFLKQYNTYCFNAARIRDWGGKRDNYSLLKSFSYSEINDMLDRLVRLEVVVQGNCSNSELYQYNSKFKNPKIFEN